MGASRNWLKTSARDDVNSNAVKEAGSSFSLWRATVMGGWEITGTGLPKNG